MTKLFNFGFINKLKTSLMHSEDFNLSAEYESQEKKKEKKKVIFN